MNYSDSSSAAIDPELVHFFEAETQKRRFKLLVHGLTDRCWDLCVSKVKNHLDGKTEGCISNCVERFIDTTNFIVNRLEKTSSAAAASSTEFN